MAGLLDGKPGKDKGAAKGNQDVCNGYPSSLPWSGQAPDAVFGG